MSTIQNEANGEIRNEAASGRSPETPYAEYRAPEGASRSIEYAPPGGRTLPIEARAEWIVLRKKEKPVAEVFHVAYLAAETPAEARPVTFVFNGGPGAASAYLHVGALGPKRVRMEPTGETPPPPVELVHNAESWLEFTDLVFVDPVGTGFSRIIERKSDGEAKKPSGGDEKFDETEFYDVKRDLESLGEFIQRFLSAHQRWRSPVFIAGESYGGFRVARLVKLLQQGYGIGLSGALLISPALEFSVLSSSDYDVLPWVDVFPSMTLAAYRHGKSKGFDETADFETVRSAAEQFAVSELPAALVDGSASNETKRLKAFRKVARYLGLKDADAIGAAGRIRPGFFARNVLREERQVCGLYDATITVVDPFPDRDGFEGPDPTLWGIERVFTAGINAHLREDLGVTTDREYHLLSLEVNEAWKAAERKDLASQVGSVDDLRYGMSINPYLRVLIAHGYYDLVTPYFASTRFASLMKLDEALSRRLTLVNYQGGHMFYTWDESRRAFRDTVKGFYRGALRDRGTARGLYNTLTARKQEAER